MISYQGKTKIVTMGDVEIRATRNEGGIKVVCNVTNTLGKVKNFKVSVSVGNGKDWVVSQEFDFPRVPAGQTAAQSTVMGASYAGELPDDPKIYIDSFLDY